MECPEGARLIPLTQGYFAIVDTEDFEWLMKWKWCLCKKKNRLTQYAMGREPLGNGKQKTIHMHRLIMNSPKGIQCDHINFNGLDNRKANLRHCNCEEQEQHRRGCKTSKSKYKGVFHHSENGRPIAIITSYGIRHYLGFFDTEIEAAKAYDQKARDLHGTFAVLNF